MTRKKDKAVHRAIRMDESLDRDLQEVAAMIPSLSLCAVMREAMRLGLPLIRKDPAKALARSA